MSKVINITDKLNSEKPKIVIGEKEYPVNDDFESVLKFEELSAESTGQGLEKAMEIALGAKAAKEINIKKMSVANIKVLSIAVMAAVQGLSYEEAEARFLIKEQ